MKKFCFTLQAVLTLRQRAEQTALECYSRALAARDGAAKAVAETEAELTQAWNLWRTQLNEGCQAAQAAQTKDYCGLLEERRVNCGKALEHAERELTTASQAMVEARQQRDVVEKYQSNERWRYDRELRSEERKEIEDLVNRRAAAPAAWKMSEHSN